MAMMLNCVNSQGPRPNSQSTPNSQVPSWVLAIGSSLGVGNWKLGVITAALLVSAATSAGAQAPQALPPAEAPAAAAVAQSAPPAQPASTSGKPAAPAPAAVPEAGYSYDPAGRRDPFVSLTSRGADLPMAAGVRPAGVPGLLIGEITVKGIFKSPKGGFLGLLQAPDGRTYTVKQSDKVFDGSVKAITADAVVFSQDVSDPLSLVKQREVRKSIRPEAR
jgi:hypothetical protein